MSSWMSWIISDFLGSTRTHVGVFDVECMHVVKERLRNGSHLGGGAAFLVGFLDDFVVYVGDVRDELRLEAAPRKVAADDVSDERWALPMWM